MSTRSFYASSATSFTGPDLRGAGHLRDFELLGVRSVKQLARQNPARLYQKLCRATGQRIDICCQDVFSAAVAQARNPILPAEQCQWWYWSRMRNASHGRR